jgi:hypothetical protein
LKKDLSNNIQSDLSKGIPLGRRTFIWLEAGYALRGSEFATKFRFMRSPSPCPYTGYAHRRVCP